MNAVARLECLAELRGIVVIMDTTQAWTLLDLMIEMSAITHQEAWHVMSANLNDGGAE